MDFRIIGFLITMMLVFPIKEISAQLDINTDINQMIRQISEPKEDDNKGKGRKIKKKKDNNSNKDEDPVYPKIDDFILDTEEFDMSILDSIAIFQPTKKFTWGDPVAHSRIRRNKASNLFGLVRHNSDGSRRWHHGFDITAPIGTPILSVGPGTVIAVGNNGGYGLCILIEHRIKKKSYFSFYAHLSKSKVKAGQNVNKGTVIGNSGTSGNAAGMTGPDEHVHFEYRTSAHGGSRNAKEPNAILRTKFYSADPKNKNQSNVSVVTKHY